MVHAGLSVVQLAIHEPGWVPWAVDLWQSSAALQCRSQKQDEQLALAEIGLCLRKPVEIEIGYVCANSCCTAEQECSIDASQNPGIMVSPSPLGISVRKQMSKNSLLSKAHRELCCLITPLAFNFCSPECIQLFFQILSPSFSKKRWI